MLLDNHGFGCIHEPGWQLRRAQHLQPVPLPGPERRGCSSGETLPIDLAANAASLGARVACARSRAELRARARRCQGRRSNLGRRGRDRSRTRRCRRTGRGGTCRSRRCQIQRMSAALEAPTTSDVSSSAGSSEPALGRRPVVRYPEQRPHAEDRHLPAHPAEAVLRALHAGRPELGAHGQARAQHPGDDRAGQALRDHGSSRRLPTGADARGATARSRGPARRHAGSGQDGQRRDGGHRREAHRIAFRVSSPHCR